MLQKTFLLLNRIGMIKDRWYYIYKTILTNMIQSICVFCGKPFEKEGRNQKFCSYRCNTQNRRKEQKTICICGRPKDTTSKECRFCFNNNKKVTRICEVCNVSFIVRQSTIKYSVARFCSSECYRVSRIGKKRPEHSKKMKQICNTPEKIELARKRMLIRCSDTAYLEKLSESSSGDKNHAWRGGIANRKYKGFYQKLKDKVRLHNNYTCQLCNKTEIELGYTLSVNHINFDKKDSKEENLNTLCKRCNSLINFDRELWTKYFQNKLANINSVG